MTGPGEYIHKSKNSDPIFDLGTGQEDFFKKNAEDVTQAQRKKLEANQRFKVKSKEFIHIAKLDNGIEQSSVDRAFKRAMKSSDHSKEYSKVYQAYHGEREMKSFPLKTSRGARYMLEGEDVLEIDFAGTGANELMRGILNEHYLDEEDALPFKEKKKTGTWGKIWRFFLSPIPGIWSTAQRDAYVERYNEKARKNREEYNKAYGLPVTLKQNGMRKNFKHIRRKDSRNTDTQATKTRYNMAGPNIINNGEYDMEHLEEYALTLGSEWLYPRLKAIARRVGDKEVPADVKKLHVMLQGHSRGGVAVSMAAMRLNKWLYDNFEEKIARLVQFDIVQYDPVPGKFSRTGIREMVDFNTDSYYDKDGKVTTEIDKAKYRSLRDQQNSTVIYTLRTQSDHFFTPQQVRGAKRVILTVRGHNSISSFESPNAYSGDRKIHRSPYLNLDSKEAYRGSAINDMPEGLYFADNLNVLHKVNSLDEYKKMCSAILQGAPEGVQEKRQNVLDEVAGFWFETHGEKKQKNPEPGVDERIQKLKEKQESLEKIMKADTVKGWEILEKDSHTDPLEERTDINSADSFITLTREEYNAKSKAEKEKYKKDLKDHEKKSREAVKKGALREKEAQLKAKIEEEARAARKEDERKLKLRQKEQEEAQKKAAEDEKERAKKLFQDQKKDYLSKNKNLEALRSQITAADDEDYKKLLMESYLYAAAKALLEKNEFSKDLTSKYSDNSKINLLGAYKLAMAELGPDVGQETVLKKLETFTVEYTKYEEPLFISNIIDKELLSLLPDKMGEDPLFRTVADGIKAKVSKEIKTVDGGWKEFELSLPATLGMSEKSDYLEDYKDPLVQKQFRDQVQNLMTKDKLSRTEAEKQVLARRREEFKTKPMALTMADSLVPVISEKKADELAKKGLYTGITEKEWKEKGGCSYTYVVDAKEAERIVEKSRGFLCASKLQTAPGEVPAPGLRVLRPSLPDTKVNINGREINVRRTYNLFIKTFIRSVTNPDGTFNLSKDYAPVIDIFDEISMLLPVGGYSSKRKEELLEKMGDHLGDQMIEILREKYNVEESDEEQMSKIYDEAESVCEDILEMVNDTRFRTLFTSEIQASNLMNNLNYLVRLKPEQIIKRIKEEDFVGQTPTDEQILAAVESVYKEIDDCAVELKKIRNLDIDGGEVPIPNTCSANSHFVSSINSIFDEGGDIKYIKYSNDFYVLSKPEEVRQYLIKNMDILAASEQISENKKASYLKKLNAMNFEGVSYTDIYGKEPIGAYIGGLPAEIKELLEIAHRFENYEYHEAAPIISDKEDGTWTTEGFAAGRSQVVSEPLTFHAGVGHYKGRIKETKSNGRVEYSIEGVNDFNNKDNCLKTDMIDAIKLRIKDLVNIRDLIPKEKFLAKEATLVKDKTLVKEKADTGIKLVNIFSREAMNVQASNRFRDKNYDSKFTQESYEKALESFRKMSLKNIHYGSVRDIAEHFKENNRLFEENREFEHMLFIAVQRGLAPADDELMKLRAKIKTIKNTEYMVCRIQQVMVENPNSDLNEKEEAKLAEECNEDLLKHITNPGGDEFPVPGMSLDTYQKQVLQGIKRSYSNRKNSIRGAYALMHPVKEKNQVGPGAISAKELESHAADYEKNAFINDYIQDLELYTLLCHGTRMTCFERAYRKKKGIKESGAILGGRVMTRYTMGMSDRELTSILDTELFGTEKEKEDLWKKIYDEIKAQNLTELDTQDPKLFLQNILYKSRMTGLLANAANISLHVKDKEIGMEAKAMYDTGCGHAQFYPLASQALRSKWFHAVPIKDLLSMNYKLIGEYKGAIEAAADDGELEYPYVADGVTVLSKESDKNTVTSTMARVATVHLSQLSSYNKKRIAAGYRNNAYVALYEARKHFGSLKDTTKEEREQLRDFFRANKALGEVPEDLSKDLTARDKTAKIENAFKKLMNMDLSLFTFNSYKDIADCAGENKERFIKCIEAVRLAAKCPEYIQQYNSLRTGNATGDDYVMKLSEEDMQEIKVRADVINQAGAFFGEPFMRILESPALEKTGMPLDEILHTTEEEIADYKKAASKDADTVKLWDDVLAFIRQLKGFDIRRDLSGYIPQRRFENGYLGMSKEKEVVDLLNGRKTEEKKEEVKEEVKEEIKDEIKDEIKEEKQEEISRIRIMQEKEQALVPLGELPQHKASVKLGVKDYEQQGTMNCWACAGALLYNAFNGVKLGQKGSINQYDVRGYNPSDKELKPYKEIKPFCPELLPEDYQYHLDGMRQYMGKNKTGFGNIYEVADFFIQKNRNMAIRRMEISVPSILYEENHNIHLKTDEQKEADRILYHEQKTAFLNQVNEVLKTGQPVAIFVRSERHFRTITAIDGEMLTVLDSSGLIQEKKHVTELLPIEEKGDVVELTWFSTLKTPKEETDDQPNLQYSEEKGYTPKVYTLENALNPTWKEGFSVTKDVDALKMKKSVYIPYKK